MDGGLMYGVQIRLLAALALVIGAAPHVSADRLNLAVGGEYSTGDYGDPQDTAVWYEFVSARYVMSPLAFKATVPFLQIDGPATVTDDGEVGGGGADRMVGGIGDVSLSTTYMFAWKPQKIYLDLMGRVRLPTGDENDGLGSGEIDYSLASTLTKEFERLSLYVEAGYRFLGSSVARPREDGMLFGTGISTDLSKETEIGASFDWREAAYATSPDPADVSIYVRHKLTDDLKLKVYALAGLSNGSPNAGGGLSLTWTAFRTD